MHQFTESVLVAIDISCLKACTCYLTTVEVAHIELCIGIIRQAAITSRNSSNTRYEWFGLKSFRMEVNDEWTATWIHFRWVVKSKTSVARRLQNCIQLIAELHSIWSAVCIRLAHSVAFVVITGLHSFTHPQVRKRLLLFFFFFCSDFTHRFTFQIDIMRPMNNAI